VLGTLCEGLDLQAPGLAAVGIAPEFHLGAQQLGTVFTAATVGLFFGALVGGRLSDAIGRRRVVIASIALFGVFSLFTALAWDASSLVWARFGTGLGLGGALPNLIALVNECSSANRRNANVALVYSATPFGGAIASLISLGIVPAHWRLLFITGGVAPLLIVPVMLWRMRESPALEPTRALQQPTDPARPAGRRWLALLEQRRLWPTLLLWLSFFIGQITLYLLLNWLPTLLVGNGLDKSQAAVAQIAFNIGGGLAALLIGILLEGRLRRPSIVIAFLAVPGLMFALSRISADLEWIVVLVFLLGSSVLASLAFLYAVAPQVYPASMRGLGVGLAIAVSRLGSIAGPKLGGVLRAAGHSYSQLLFDLVPVVLAGAVAAIVLAWCTLPAASSATGPR
jgi:AAHS family 3-hydroxyphenylpropionic acid transporter